jgi:hypothetical protein
MQCISLWKAGVFNQNYLVLGQSTEKALLHRAKQEPLAHAPGAEVQWKFEVQCKAKAQEGGNKKK